MAYIRRRSGLIVPSDEAISGGLSFAWAAQNGPRSAFVTRGAVATQDYTGGQPGVLGPGVGLTGGGAGNSAWGDTSASNSYAVDTTAGTIIAYLVADHASTDGNYHEPFWIGNVSGFPANPTVSLVKASTGQWYGGWSNAGADNRVIAGATYAANEAFTMAVAWGPGGQKIYQKGALLGSKASASYGNTAGSYFAIGWIPTVSWQWATSANGGVLHLVIYDRELSAQEIAAAEADPWWWSDRSRRPVWKAEAATSIAGTLSATLAAATLASTATVAIAGTSSATLAAATLSATGTLAISSTASATLAATTVVAAGTVALTGSTTATLAAATLAGTGTISLSATLTSTLDDATLAATGTAGTVVTGTLAVTLDAATLAAASTLALRGTTTTTLANATLAGTGTLSLRATSSVTLGDATLSATGINGNVVNAIVLVWNGVRI